MFGLKSFAQKLHESVYLRSQIVLLMDLLVSLIASLGVFLVVFLLLPHTTFDSNVILTWIVSSFVASAIAFVLTKIHRAIIRYSSLHEIGRICLAALGKDLLLWIGMLAFTSFGTDSSLIIGMVTVDFLLTICLLVLVRVALYVIYGLIANSNRQNRHTKRILVYGISNKAVALVPRLHNSKHYSIIGFITHGTDSKGHLLYGLPVYYFDNANDVKNLANKYDIDGILFPFVADARAEQDQLISYCHEAEVKTYLTPNIDEMTEQSPLANFVRKVKIEDLLGRPEIKISMNEIIANFNGKVVMVTGAAGSIGSELCRQLSTFGVKQLILFDNAETPLHNIRLELEGTFPQLNFVPVIGDVREKARLDFVFRKYNPQIVFHAAAYKHVPLMEENPCEAVHVNVVGSRNVADKCVEYNVEKMVMVSTDKAVNPTNIMGCTKRLAEIYVQSLGLAIERGEVNGHTKFVTTRFGNVLGSNGSVIPRFREQIERGGPVTVTDPEIRRFFMTIPEACRLVMEAATFATGTQIFVFDMGESVKIATLAERMINLAGLEVGKDIKIEYTGLRPGEKLYEEVLATKENTIPTDHERIFVAKVRQYDYNETVSTTNALENLSVEVNIPDMVILMKKIVPEFKSKHSEFEKYDLPDANTN
ncbi:MAG: polysaccharide biosynthesis protein [Muribaculaceae bacterium]|nr:polysaccharide biosynthesis protein [Muribaculaceae bacterium]